MHRWIGAEMIQTPLFSPHCDSGFLQKIPSLFPAQRQEKTARGFPQFTRHFDSIDSIDSIESFSPRFLK